VPAPASLFTRAGFRSTLNLPQHLRNIRTRLNDGTLREQKKKNHGKIGFPRFEMINPHVEQAC
jgi:hypothetical protein